MIYRAAREDVPNTLLSVILNPDIFPHELHV